MKVVHMQTHRTAIAMIELIFSIVIMGIVLLSAPMLMSVSTKSSIVAFQQESIAVTAAKANAVMTYAWDESNTASQGLANQYSIISTDSTTTELDRTTSLRSTMTRLSDATLSATSTADFGPAKDIDPATSDIELIDDDIDDLHGQVKPLQLALDANASLLSDTGDLMDIDVNITTTIDYGTDDPSSTYAACASTGGCAFSQPFTGRDSTVTTNIKRINITLSSTNMPDKVISLKAFACNIGAAKIKTEKF